MRLVLLLSGAAGFVILGRVMVLSPAEGAGAGRLTSFVLALMALSLCAGLIELWLRERRASRNERALSELRESLRERGERADEAGLEALDGAVVARIRARVERQPVGALVPSLTPHIAGLLVALGLIGGFVGLIDTLVGAEQALETSGHWRTLRINLQEPVLGLAEGLEVSAAGVCAAVLLLVGGVGVRRREDRLAEAADALAASAQAPVSSLGDQLDVMGALIRQADALPQAARSLSGVSDQLTTLERTFVEASERTTRETLGIVREAMMDFRAELKHAFEESARSTKEAVTPLLEDAVERTLSAATGHLDQVLARVGEDFDARREAERSHTRALEAHAASLGEQAEADRAARDARAEAQERALEEGFTRLREAEDERVGMLSSRLEALGGRLGEVLDRRRDRDVEHDRLLGEIVAELKQSLAATSDLTALHAEATERMEVEWQSRSEGIVGRLADLGAELQAQSERQLGALQDYVDRAESRAVRHEAVAAEQVDGLLEGVAERQQLQLDALTELGRTMTERSDEQLAAVARYVEEARSRSSEDEAAVQARLQALLGAMGEAQAEQIARLGELEDRLLAQSDRLASAHAEALRGQVDELSGRLSASGELLHEAATLVKAGGAELSGLAELFAQAVDRQKEAAAAWLESLGEVEGAVERAGRGAAADALRDQLEGTHQLFARQLEFQRELFDELRALRETGGPPPSGEEHAAHG